MCGLFGLLRSPGAAHPEYASQAFVLLGVLAEERGADGAGVALFSGQPSGSPAPAAAISARDVRLPGCRVVKGPGRFSRVWRPALEEPLDRAVLALGHTRWATQGGRRPADTSPMLAGTLAGTHNGDVDAAALRARFGVPASAGTTDSEVIFQAIAGGGDAAARLEVLSGLTGRAALVWADRTEPRRVHLARAALNPLAVAWDNEGNVWWASNPQWLRIARQETPVQFLRMALLAEGTYAVIAAGDTGPRGVLRRQFVPLARPVDLRCNGVWRGFTHADRAEADHTGLRRRVICWPGRRPGAAALPARRGSLLPAGDREQSCGLG